MYQRHKRQVLAVAIVILILATALMLWVNVHMSSIQAETLRQAIGR